MTDEMISVKRSTVLECVGRGVLETKMLVLAEDVGHKHPRTRLARLGRNPKTGDREYWSIEHNPILLRDFAQELLYIYVAGSALKPLSPEMLGNRPIWEGGAFRAFWMVVGCVFETIDGHDASGLNIWVRIEESRYDYIRGWRMLVLRLYQDLKDQDKRRVA